MFKIGGFVIICLIVTLGYGVGLLKFLTEHHEDKCEMTYMFEYPQFVKISHQVDKKYTKYGLYAYSEGRLTEKTRNMYFNGIPVLFIAGNAGSYKQVRSLSSVALRKSLDSRIPYHFDYFTVDLNEEYTGLYGPLLYDQLHFINSCLYRILDLYKQRSHQPESVIIVGHSVGGIIALKLVSELSDPKLVPLVITLATPLKRLPLLLDYHMANFYNGNLSNIPEATTVVSLSGGYKDYLIPPYLSEKKSNESLYAVTTNVPMCWIEANHIQIVWCKQIVMAVNRALFDSIDTSTNQISFNSTQRKAAFHHHLIHHSGTRVRNHDKYFKTSEIDNRGEWTESILKRYTIKYANGVRQTRWHMVSLSDVPGYDVLTILAVNLETVDWVFACNANFPRGSSRICSEAIHLTHMSEISPSVKHKRRYFRVNMRDLRKSHGDLTHVVFRVFPTNEPVVFHVDIHANEERNITVDLPKWWSFKNHVILERTAEKSLHYELVLHSLQHIIQSYHLYVQPLECSKENYHATASLIIPWSNENYHSYFTNVDNKPMDIRLYSSKLNRAKHTSAVIKLTLDPSCIYQISIKASLPNMLAQTSRSYTPLLSTNVAAVTLMSFRFQLKSLEKGYCSMVFSAINEGAKPYFVLTFTKVMSQILISLKAFSYVPRPDIAYLAEEGTDFLVLPLLLYLCGAGIVWMFAVVLGVSLIALESTVHKIALKFLARTVSFNVVWSDYLLGVLHKVPIVVATALVVLSLTTCGGLALCLGCVFYFLRLTQMSQDFVEEVVWFFVKKLAKKFKNFFKRKNTEETSKVTESNKLGNKFSAQSLESSKQTGNAKINTKELQPNYESQMKDPSTSYPSTSHGETNPDENAVDSRQKDRENELEDPATSYPSTSHGDTNPDKNTVCGRQEDQESEISPTQNETEERIEDIRGNVGNSITGTDMEISEAYNSIFFHSSLFFMWCIVTVINIPAVLTWAHNFKYSTALTPDDSFIPGTTLSLCALALWQFDFPRTDRKWLDKLGTLVTVMAVISLMFATVSLYRLNYILSFTIAMVTLQQLFAPKLDVEGGDSAAPEDDDERDKYSGVKSKME